MDWNELPSVVLQDIYKFLPIRDRLNASSICNNWRASVFQIPFHDTLHLIIGNYESDSSKYHFLSSNFAHKVSHLSLTFDAVNPNCMDLVCDTLTNCERNSALRTLQIRCTEESLAKGIFNASSIPAQLKQTYFVKKIVQPVIAVVRSRNLLETFSFPWIEELIQQQLQVIETLANSRLKNYTVRSLFLATMRTTELFKQSPTEWNHSKIVLSHIPVIAKLVTRFYRLQVLSIDHEVLTDSLLATLSTGGQSSGLIRLNLVAVQGNPYVSNAGWTAFVINNPNCKVRLTVMGGRALVEQGSNLCFASTPLTHFRALYCQRIRMTMLNSLILWNENRLEHLELVNENHDWMENIIQSANEVGNDFIDPLIFAAWRVKSLHTIKIGYLYCGQDIIGIARLAEGRLIRFEIPKSQILYRNMDNLCSEVSKALGKPWAPVDDQLERFPRSRSQVLNNKMSSSYQAVIFDENLS